jgi:capsid protein
MGLVDLKESIETFRRTVLVFQFCRQVYRRWFSEAVLAGALPLKAAEFNRNPGLYLRAEWQMPQWTWVDPLKEAETDVRLVRAAFKSRESAIIARGGSLEAVDAGIARSNESARRQRHRARFRSAPHRRARLVAAARPERARPGTRCRRDRGRRFANRH